MKIIHTTLMLGCCWPALAQEPTRDQQHRQEELERQRQTGQQAMARGTIDLRKGETVLGANIHLGHAAGVMPPAGEDVDDRPGHADKPGEKVGEVENLIVRAQDGSIAYAVVSFDEGIGTREKLVALPFDVLRPQMSTDRDRLVFDLNVDKERLRSAPSFDEDKWPDLTTSEGLRNVDEFFREFRDAMRDLPEITRRDDVGTQPAGARLEQPLLLRFDKVRGCQVDTSSGQNAGEIEEIAVDVRNGTIGFALLSTGGFLGLGEDHHAVPWKAFEFTTKMDDPDDKDRELVCRLTIPESQLENAPKYDKNDWDKVNDPSYLERVYTHYGVTPYWRGAGNSGRTEPDPNRKPGDR